VQYLRTNRTEPWGLPATVAWEYLSFYTSRSRRRQERHRLEQHFQDIAPLTLDVASEAATLSQLLSEQNITLDAADLLHAATARANGATFVTADANDFDRPPIHDLMDVDVVFIS
jgi:predicted nucleic acid-binding protein